MKKKRVWFKRRYAALHDLGISTEDLQSRTLYQDAWKRLKKNKVAMVSLGAIIIIAIIAIFAPLIAPYSPYETDPFNNLQPPSAEHWCGTDNLGRDILSRIIYGARVSLLVGIVCELIAVPIGIIMGSIAGYYGGIADMVISRIIEVLGSFPFIIFAICVMFILGTGIMNVFIALGVIGWLGHARQIRAAVIQLKSQDFVEAAKASGASDFSIIFRHLLPNCLSTVIVIATIDIPSDIMFEATLSFMGLGIQPPQPSWGSMINEARAFLRQVPTYSIFPGIAIMILVLAFNTLGDGLRDALDPKLKNL
ncbi:MAG: ABC transporter permease [Firmicutes bacterium]|nr:ABC transporter permease [Bacillota bacterium]MBQ6662058.1 ABC transporter permease [Bacillota bacterium]MCR4711771.1 ABC transporter permease [Clostridia bacterium]